MLSVDMVKVEGGRGGVEMDFENNKTYSVFPKRKVQKVLEDHGNDIHRVAD
ncbi:921_t:CDS:2, partial [Entrophospora sp. SA101]